MTYNFEIRTTFSEDELKQVASKTVDGLEASSQLIIEAKIKTNTELPGDKVELLRQAVKEVIATKLGSETEIILISQEH
ncbi:MAG TPA: hypothetical protein VFC63_19290 [Blastocatellia bacterium]|nr:hypothetical protein [Blastocatellia bacterium]